MFTPFITNSRKRILDFMRSLCGMKHAHAIQQSKIYRNILKYRESTNKDPYSLNLRMNDSFVKKYYSKINNFFKF